LEGWNVYLNGGSYNSNATVETQIKSGHYKFLGGFAPPFLTKVKKTFFILNFKAANAD